MTPAVTRQLPPPQGRHALTYVKSVRIRFASCAYYSARTYKLSGGETAVKVIIRVCAALAIICLALLSVLFVLDLVPSELFKEAAMKLLTVGAIVTASLIALSLTLRK